MSSGERPIGAAKGKQSDTEALCQPPPPPSIIKQRPDGGRGWRRADQGNAQLAGKTEDRDAMPPVPCPQVLSAKNRGLTNELMVVNAALAEHKSALAEAKALHAKHAEDIKQTHEGWTFQKQETERLRQTADTQTHAMEELQRELELQRAKTNRLQQLNDELLEEVACLPGFVDEELLRKGVGGVWGGGVPRRAAYSNLICPQPNFGSRFFFWLGGSQSQKDPSPLLKSKACCLLGLQLRPWPLP